MRSPPWRRARRWPTIPATELAGAAAATWRCRALTDGERALCREVFGATLDAGRVTVNRAKWWLFQPRRVAMAPDGHLWLHPKGPDCHPDFSVADLASQGLFVHEMTHVWQHQQGINLLLRRRPWDSYRYLPLQPGKRFEEYNVEQQAEIVREGWMARRGYILPGRPTAAAYAALVPFWRGA